MISATWSGYKNPHISYCQCCLKLIKYPWLFISYLPISYGLRNNTTDYFQISGILYFNAKIAEKLLFLTTEPPLNNCTYLGADSGVKPMQVGSGVFDHYKDLFILCILLYPLLNNNAYIVIYDSITYWIKVLIKKCFQ